MAVAGHDYLPTLDIFGHQLEMIPSFVGFGIELFLMILLIWFYHTKKDNAFVLFFDSLFEKAFSFFEDILGVEEKYWIKSYVVSLFFVILISNTM